MQQNVFKKITNTIFKTKMISYFCEKQKGVTVSHLLKIYNLNDRII